MPDSEFGFVQEFVNGWGGRVLGPCTRAYIHTTVHCQVHSYIHTLGILHTYINTYVHTYINTYIHACMQACIYTIHTYGQFIHTLTYNIHTCT